MLFSLIKIVELHCMTELSTIVTNFFYLTMHLNTCKLHISWLIQVLHQEDYCTKLASIQSLSLSYPVLISNAQDKKMTVFDKMYNFVFNLDLITKKVFFFKKKVLALTSRPIACQIIISFHLSKKLMKSKDMTKGTKFLSYENTSFNQLYLFFDEICVVKKSTKNCLPSNKLLLNKKPGLLNLKWV